MRLYFLRSPHADAPDHSGEFPSPRSLYLWLVGQPGTYAVAVECLRGPVMVLGPRAGYLTIRGGLSLPQSDVDTLWQRASDTVTRDMALDQFLDGLGGFVRGAMFPAPKLVTHNDS